MPHALGPGRIDHGEAHVAFAGMDRRADVVHLLDAADRPGKYGWLANVADYYLVDAQAT